MNYKYPLATSTWGKEEIDAMQSVINSGNFTMGEKVKDFENSFANYLGCKFCVMVNSGSSANLLMVASLFYTNNLDIKLKRGDEIIVPAVSWSTTYYPFYQYGLKIKFVDIDLKTLNYDLDKLEKAITVNTRLIMIVNLLGNPNDFDLIFNMVKGRNITLLEDNCESLGATYQGKKTGTFGLMGSFSTFFSHHISTMEGGLIATDDEEFFHLLLSLRAHGWTRNLPNINKVTGVKSNDVFEESFKFILPGYNFRPLELEGAIGIEQLRKLPSIIEERRRNASIFQTVMSSHPDLLIQREIGESSWFGFSLIIRKTSKINRQILIRRLNELGFECRPIVAGNFAKNKVVKYFNYEIFDDLRNSEYIDKNGLFIGNHHYNISDTINQLSKI